MSHDTAVAQHPTRRATRLISASLCVTSTTAHPAAATRSQTPRNATISSGGNTAVGSSSTRRRRLAHQALDDLDPLPLADGKIADDGQGIERQAEFQGQFLDPLSHRRRA